MSILLETIYDILNKFKCTIVMHISMCAYCKSKCLVTLVFDQTPISDVLSVSFFYCLRKSE